MRVKISYGIGIEEIPEEVQKLFDNVGEYLDTLSKQSDTIDDLLEAEEIGPCVSVMNKMRQTLGKMDARISDLSNILEGYSDYLKQNGVEDELQPPERRPVMDPTSSDAVSGAEQPNGSEVE